MVKNTALLRKRSIRGGIGSRIFDVLNVGFLVLFTLSILYPFIYMFSISISDPELVAMNKVVFWPMGKLTIEAYADVIKSNTLLSAYRNSIVYAFSGTLISISVACLGGYALTKKFKLRTFFTLILLATMFIRPGLIPNYINIKNLRLLNTMWAFVLPASLSMWFIILARTNFLQIPESLFETAYLDGANDWYVLFKIVLPLSTAIIATLAVFASIGYWNNYMGPLIYLTDPDKMPLPILLRNILIVKVGEGDLLADINLASDSENVLRHTGQIISLRMATIFITIGPIILIYPFAQKYFLKGVMVGSVKG